MSNKWNDITRDDVEKAIEIFIEECPDYPAAKSTFLMYNGKKLPAKHIRGMAYKVRYGVEIKKEEYAGGMETVRFFKRLGFETYHVKKNTEENKLVDMTTNLEENVEKKEETFVDTASVENKRLKVGMYLQTDELKYKKEFDKALKVVKNSDIDIWVFPEVGYVPFEKQIWKSDIFDWDDYSKIVELCLKLSKDAGRAVVVSSKDRYGTLFSIFANAYAKDDEEGFYLYVKHTMTDYSAFEHDDYKNLSKEMFEPLEYKGFRIGFSICYDCNHSLFSRMFGLKDVDLIINSTGGDVIYDKWYKYNKARAIENSCYNLVTMGGDGFAEKPKCYVYGFNANGGELTAENICGDSSKNNVPGGIYVYEILKEPGLATVETSLNQKATVNKVNHCYFPVGKMNRILDEAKKLREDIYLLEVEDMNVIICVIDGLDIMKPEKVLPLLYAPELKKYKNKRYVIFNHHKTSDKEFFETKLSIILKVRAMENFCGVILESDEFNYCYQAGFVKTAQTIKAVDGYYGVDLSRTSGPESIWKNKLGTKKSWRENFEWLISECINISKD